MVVEEWNFSSFKLHTKFYPSDLCFLYLENNRAQDLANLADRSLAGKRLLAWDGDLITEL